ncbi:MAG: hypothetical protein LBQ68_01480, partial [Clostridiales bacterium]|nr:hypothetical protein [Clostridiales bacterium]
MTIKNFIKRLTAFVPAVTLLIALIPSLSLSVSADELPEVPDEPTWSATVAVGNLTELKGALADADAAVPTEIQLTANITYESDADGITIPASKTIKLTSQGGPQ